MFTGIIQGLGRVAGKRQSSVRNSLLINTALVDQLNLGDSVAVNGVCLTVARLEPGAFEADIMPETWKGSNLSQLKLNDPVNLEPAMVAGGRLGGHLVSGHVDGLGRVVRINRDGNARLIQITTSPAINRWVIQKGSIAVNGVSLTVQRLVTEGFVVSLIPQTLKETTFQTVKAGDWVNLETDQLLKCGAVGGGGPGSVKSGITEAFLVEHGFWR